jgi:hypothetical protein
VQQLPEWRCRSWRWLGFCFRPWQIWRQLSFAISAQLYKLFVIFVKNVTKWGKCVNWRHKRCKTNGYQFTPASAGVDVIVDLWVKTMTALWRTTTAGAQSRNIYDKVFRARLKFSVDREGSSFFLHQRFFRTSRQMLVGQQQIKPEQVYDFFDNCDKIEFKKVVIIAKAFINYDEVSVATKIRVSVQAPNLFFFLYKQCSHTDLRPCWLRGIS